MSRRESFLWIAAYVAMIVGVGSALRFVRDRVITTLDTPQARADWQAWREAAAKQAAEGPVRRQVPQSTEPPALVLMRDYFIAIVSGALLFSTILFVTFAWFLRGALSSKQK